MSMLEHVNLTLTELKLDPQDAAAQELCRTYARELDGAAAVRARADKAVKEARLRGDDEHTAEVEALRAKLSERSALVQIGNLLHKLLAELQATPKARGGLKPAAAKTGTLHRLRSAT